MSAEPDRTLRIAVAEDSYLVREALVHVLEAAPGVEVIASCDDLDSALAVIDEQLPDVVVSDIRMPPTLTDEGMRLAAYVRERHPAMGVVILSQFPDPKYGLALFDDGSDRRAYLLKERVSHRGQLVAAIQAVAEGGSMIDAKIVQGLIEARQRRHDSGIDELTPRELEILKLIARGCSNQAIADELVLTKRAVEKHVNAILLKLRLSESAVDVSRRVKAALIFLAAHDDEGPAADRSAAGPS